MTDENRWDITFQNQWQLCSENHLCYFCQSPALIKSVSGYMANDFACPVCGRYRLLYVEGVNNGHQYPPHSYNRQKVSHLLAERYFRRETESFVFLPPKDDGTFPENPWQGFKTASIEGLAETYPSEAEIPKRILQSLEIYKKNRGISYGEEIKVDLYVDPIRGLGAMPLNTHWAFCETKEAFERTLSALKQRKQIEYRFDREAVYIDLTPYTVAKEHMEQNQTINIGTNYGVVAPNAKNSNITNLVNGVDDAKFAELLEKVKASAVSLSEAERKEVAEALAVVQDYKNGACGKNAFNFAVKALKAINGSIEFAANVATLLSCFGVVAAL